jgi:hypothetical protein
MHSLVFTHVWFLNVLIHHDTARSDKFQIYEYLSVVFTTCSMKISVHWMSHALISRRYPLSIAHTVYSRGRCIPSHALECYGLNYGIYYPCRCLSCSLLLWCGTMEKIQSRIGNQGPQLTFRLKIGTMLHYRHHSERASLGLLEAWLEFSIRSRN